MESGGKGERERARGGGSERERARETRGGGGEEEAVSLLQGCKLAWRDSLRSLLSKGTHFNPSIQSFLAVHLLNLRISMSPYYVPAS